eukprot:6465269-Amphidinium_carterae.1
MLQLHALLQGGGMLDHVAQHMQFVCSLHQFTCFVRSCLAGLSSPSIVSFGVQASSIASRTGPCPWSLGASHIPWQCMYVCVPDICHHEYVEMGAAVYAQYRMRSFCETALSSFACDGSGCLCSVMR